MPLGVDFTTTARLGWAPESGRKGPVSDLERSFIRQKARLRASAAAIAAMLGRTEGEVAPLMPEARVAEPLDVPRIACVVAPPPPLEDWRAWITAPFQPPQPGRPAPLSHQYRRLPRLSFQPAESADD